MVRNHQRSYSLPFSPSPPFLPSSLLPDILPHIWIDRFTTLQDDVPPKPGHEIIRIVER